MAQGLRLLVGLGNPGEEYRATRHNVGFAVADRLAAKLGVEPSYDGSSKALVGRGSFRGCQVLLAKPLTYMNRSGRSVRHLLQTHGLALEDVLIVYDDLNLPVGRIRLRGKGSAGGHNGVQSIIDVLGSDAFPRLRVGIGDDYRRGNQVEYVLSPFSSEQTPRIQKAIDRSRDAALCYVTEGLSEAMNRYN